MLYKMIVNIGFMALGYYLGREVGRTEGVREQLLHARKSGGSTNMRDAVVIDREKSASSNGQSSVNH